MQPYLFPYISYFQLINAVDKFVIYDDVNYIKGGWINRNNILANNKKHRFTIALNQTSSFKLINEISINDNFTKLLKTIHYSYIKAPYFLETYNLLENIFSYREKNLSKFITNSILHITNHLRVKTELIVSSTINQGRGGENKEKVIHICKLLGASTYINAIGGQELYFKPDFTTNYLELKFLKTNSIIYKQFDNEFVPWLSIIDVMMFNSKENIVEMLNHYELE